MEHSEPNNFWCFISYVFQKLYSDECLHAVGQGALAVECKFENKKILQLLKTLNHKETAQAVIAERALMRELVRINKTIAWVFFCVFFYINCKVFPSKYFLIFWRSFLFLNKTNSSIQQFRVSDPLKCVKMYLIVLEKCFIKMII